jgi:subtilisin family serine protease
MISKKGSPPYRGNDFSWFNPEFLKEKGPKPPTESRPQGEIAATDERNSKPYMSRGERSDRESILDQDLKDLITGPGPLSESDNEFVKVILEFDSANSLTEFWNKIGGIAGMDTETVEAGDRISDLDVGDVIGALTSSPDIKTAFEESLRGSIAEKDVQPIEIRARSHVESKQSKKTDADKLELVNSVTVSLDAAQIRALGEMFDKDPTVREKLPILKIFKEEEYTEMNEESAVQIGVNPSVWNQGFDGSGINVAVIDSGCDVSSDDFRGRIIGNADFTGHNGEDDSGHGTHVAGTILGNGNLSGGRFRGMAYNANLLVAKVLHGGRGNTTDIIKGIDWAVKSGADVMNCSLGGGAKGRGDDPLSKAVNRAVQDFGVVVCVAAGNAGRVIGQPGKRNRSSIGSPGAAVYAITVGAGDKWDNVADFSSIGPTLVSSDPNDWKNIKPNLVAPGVDIVSVRARTNSRPYTPPTYQTKPDLPIELQENYTYKSGTSMATPVTAGLCALLLQAYKTKNNIKNASEWNVDKLKERSYGNRTYPGNGNLAMQIKHILMTTAKKLPREEEYEIPGSSNRFGWESVSVVSGAGRIQAVDAINRIIGEVPVPVPVPVPQIPSSPSPTGPESFDILSIVTFLKNDDTHSLPVNIKYRVNRLKIYIIQVLTYIAQLRLQFRAVSSQRVQSIEGRYISLVRQLLDEYNSLKVP